MKTTYLVLSLTILCGMPLAASAEDKPKHSDISAKQRSDTRREWTETDSAIALKTLHEINLEEIEAGNLAKEFAITDGVRDFSEMLVDDHGAADEKVKGLANKRNTAMADRLPADSEAASAIMRLSQLREAAFERQFLDMMVEGHERAIALAKTWIKDTSDDELRALLKETLPRLQLHRDTARKLSHRPPKPRE